MTLLVAALAFDDTLSEPVTVLQAFIAGLADGGNEVAPRAAW
jgi:hypothetical protein